MSCLYYYKLVSEFPCDNTKNCRLSINELDSNFYELKKDDVKEVGISDDKKTIILTTKGGEEIVANMPYVTDDVSIVNDVNVAWDKESGCITIKWTDADGEHEQVIDDLVTSDKVMAYVLTDRSLKGDGTKEHPLMVNPVDETGAYSPVKKVINKEDLPEVGGKGDRYVTAEYISDYGYLYTFDGVAEIQQMLSEAHSEWRIPSKDDIDTLFNYAETCEQDRNHNSKACHRYLGVDAGKNLKSADKWKECILEPYEGEDGMIHRPLQPEGVDKYGLRVLPAGFGDSERKIEAFTEKAAFWTTSHVNDDPEQDIYVKIFDYRKASILQEADCPDMFYSIRLVKDYTGLNDYGPEEIEGNTYPTVLLEELGQIWTKINVCYPTESERLVPNYGDNLDQRLVYFMNVWTGNRWDKKELKNGDTFIVNEGAEGVENDELRVFVDESGNQYLMQTDEVIYDRVIERVMPIIDEEREARIETDNQLWEAINNEVSARTDVDTQLWEAINIEVSARTSVDSQLWDNLNNEITQRIDVDNQLWDAFNNEAEIREEVDNQQWEAINNEVSARTETDAQLWEAINNEVSARTDVDTQLWDAINNEAAVRKETDDQQWDAINNEISARTETDAQLWTVINNEITDRSAVDAQMWDAINNESAIREEVDNQQWEVINNEIERATENEARIEAQLIDNPKNKKNINTPDEYVIESNSGDKPSLKLFSQGGTNDIEISLDSNYGTF